MERQVDSVRGTRWTARSSAGHMVQEEQVEVVDDLLVEPQNHHRVGAIVAIKSR
jgi:hypothetical protein